MKRLGRVPSSQPGSISHLPGRSESSRGTGVGVAAPNDASTRHPQPRPAAGAASSSGPLGKPRSPSPTGTKGTPKQRLEGTGVSVAAPNDATERHPQPPPATGAASVKPKGRKVKRGGKATTSALPVPTPLAGQRRGLFPALHRANSSPSRTAQCLALLTTVPSTEMIRTVVSSARH